MYIYHSVSRDFFTFSRIRYSSMLFTIPLLVWTFIRLLVRIYLLLGLVLFYSHSLASQASTNLSVCSCTRQAFIPLSIKYEVCKLLLGITLFHSYFLTSSTALCLVGIFPKGRGRGSLEQKVKRSGRFLG